MIWLVDSTAIFQIYFSCQPFDNGWDFWKIKTFYNVSLHLGFPNKAGREWGSYSCYLAVGVWKIKFIYKFTVLAIHKLVVWELRQFPYCKSEQKHINFIFSEQIIHVKNSDEDAWIAECVSSFVLCSQHMWCHPLLVMKLTGLFHAMKKHISNTDLFIHYHVQ